MTNGNACNNDYNEENCRRRIFELISQGKSHLGEVWFKELLDLLGFLSFKSANKLMEEYDYKISNI